MLTKHQEKIVEYLCETQYLLEELKTFNSNKEVEKYRKEIYKRLQKVINNFEKGKI